MNAHVKRWVTALVAGPLVILLVLFGSGFHFALLVALLAVVSSLEFSWMCFGRQARSELTEGIALSLLIVSAAASGDFTWLAAAVTAAFVISFLFFLFRIGTPEIDLSLLGKAVLGFIGLPLLIAHLILVRNLPDGIIWIFLVFLTGVVGDVSAFYVGRKFGKRKLMPNVSPAKTREGAVASIAGSLIFGLVYRYFLLPEVSIGHMVVISAVANILCQLGDLSESAIKRSAGAKDSGFIFPGHGGVLDRLDAFLFSAPFVYYYKILVIG